METKISVISPGTKGVYSYAFDSLVRLNDLAETSPETLLTPHLDKEC